MSIAQSSKISHSAEATIRIDCLLRDLQKRPVTFGIFTDDCPYLKSCEITLRKSVLDISLGWKIEIQCGRFDPNRYFFQKLKVFTKGGKPVTAEWVEKRRDITTVRIESSDVSIGKNVVFDVILSSNVNSRLNPRNTKHYSRYGDSAIATLMKDIGTMDMALTFGINGGARNISLWAHRSVLEQQPGLAKLINKLKSVEGSLTDSSMAPGVQSHHVHEYSLEGYCSLIRFLYMGSIQLLVDLDDFAIGCPPTKPLSPSCKQRPAIYDLFSPTTLTASSSALDTKTHVTRPLLRTTTFGELFQLADCYEVHDLRAYCRTQILESLTPLNSLEILFGFAYRFDDLKDEVLQYVSHNLAKMYNDGEDPFDKYKDHPERHSFLAEALKLKFMGSEPHITDD
ncbi:hypothetical protein BG006_007295 [Podila minutissima]|uniref:BTB domain-containing protein n=1 Tax=Podila minutissima TaxID=64525 RepID=A0A9P5SKG2_9FUNG|nr:hypothetical protein BG006_007295 [Podila minutissima]